MNVQAAGQGWPDLLGQLTSMEKEVPNRRNLERLYFSQNQTEANEDEHQFAFIREQIYYSPSEKPSTVLQGMPAEDETRVRLFVASIVRKVGVLLSIPTETICIAQSILHRFFYSQSLIDFDFKEVSAACLLLACKVTDIHQNIKQIIASFDFAFRLCFMQPENITTMDPTSDIINHFKSRVIRMEVEILYALGYEVQTLLVTPHKFLLMFLKTLKADREFAELTWNFCNDSYLGSTPLHYPPELIATSCIYLAYRVSGTPMPKVAWWLLAEYDIATTEEAARALYSVYTQNMPSLAEACSLVEGVGKLTHKAFFISPTFGQTYYDADKERLGREGERLRNHDPRQSLPREKHERNRTELSPGLSSLEERPEIREELKQKKKKDKRKKEISSSRSQRASR